MNKELNLLPQIYNEVKATQKKKKNIILGIIGVVVLIILGIGFSFGRGAYLNIQKVNLQEEIDRNQKMVDREKELAEQITITDKHIKKAKDLDVLKSKSTDKTIKDLQELFPSSIVLTNLDYTKVTLNLAGKSTSKADIEVLWANLRESDQFKNSYVTSISEGEGGFIFNIEVILGGGESVDGESK